MNMTNSTELRELKSALTDFLEGQCSFSELQTALDGYVNIDFAQAPHYRRVWENALDGVICIPVEERHLQNALRLHIDSKISETELSNWAAFIFLSGAFVPSGETEDERQQAGEGIVWDLLQRLMSPGVFGGLNRETVQHYLDLLRP